MTINVPSNDSTGGPSAPLVPSSVKLLDPISSSYGSTVTIPGEGTYTVDPGTGVVTFDPLPTFAGDATGVTYQISDANGTAQTALILVTVKGPPKANPDTATTPQNVNVTLTPIANDTLGDFGGPPFNPTSVQLLDPATNTYNTSLTVAGQGTYTANTVSGKVVFDPLPTFTGVASPVTYQVRDGDGIPASSTLTVTVTAISPAAVNDTARTPADIDVTVNPLSNDTAGAASAALDPASVKLQDPADNVFKASITVAGEGTYTVDPITGAVTFDPVFGFSGAATPVTYQVADTNGTSATATLTITVEEPPVANPDTRTTDQNVTISLNPLANDAPGATANTPLDPTRVRLQDPADNVYKASVTIPGEGTYTANTTTGEVTFDPVSAFTGVATPVRYQIRDLDGARAATTITITVASLVPTAVDDAATTSDDADI
ncbi:MAG: Ig-like domain-containing protein, partial [Angustibacter sp.]